MPAADPGSPGGPAPLLLIDPGGAASGPIRAAVERTLPPDAWLLVDDGTAGSTIADELRIQRTAARKRLVLGAFPVGVDERWRRPGRVAVLLHDPIARVRYLHARHRRSLGEGGAALRPPSLEAFVFEQQRLATDNGQVRLLAGRDHLGFGAVDAAAVDAAIAHATTRAVAVLFADEPKAVLATLGKLIGLDLGPPGPADGTRIAPADRTLVERIRAHEAGDIRLVEALRRHAAGGPDHPTASAA